MVVYIETNFLLEIALQHEQHESCQQLLTLAENGQIELVVPAFSLTEPYGTLVRRENESGDLALKITQGLDQIGRAVSIATIAEEALRIPELLGEISEQRWERLRDVQNRLLSVATIVAQDAAVIISGLEVERHYTLSRPDAVVFSSILLHLQAAPAGNKAFLELDRHFNNPTVRAELRKYGCDLVPSFEDGLKRITSVLGV